MWVLFLVVLCWDFGFITSPSLTCPGWVQQAGQGRIPSSILCCALKASRAEGGKKGVEAGMALEMEIFPFLSVFFLCL